MVLDIKGLTMDFGGLRAVNSFDCQLEKNEIVALIGPNGAGKTTVFNCITGVYHPTGGSIHITPPEKSTEKIDGSRPHAITERGLARTFQNIRLFQNMTVLENVMMGRHCRLKAGVLGAILRNRSTKAEEERIIEDSHAVLEELGLERWVNEIAKNLPYGAQRRLEIARALATDPFLLLLDEPAAGMNPLETRHLDELILQIRDSRDITILLIEHDMSLVMRLSERILVMDYGKLIAQGTPNEIKRDPLVIKAYLGEESIGSEFGRAGSGGDGAGDAVPTGQEAAGQEAAGQEAAGQEASGEEASSQKASGQEASGEESNGEEGRA